MSPRTSQTLKIKIVPIAKLRLDPGNPRQISEEQLDALTRSLDEFGCVSPVVALRDGTVISGHQRIVATLRSGGDVIPVIYVDLSPEKARLLGLALNRISGDWDEKLLANLLKSLGEDPAVDLKLSGFGEDEIRSHLKRLDAQAKSDLPECIDFDAAVRSAYENPRVGPGETFQLGDHRISCADATKVEDVKTLMAGAKAGAAVTDPPYSVHLGRHGGQQPGQRRRYIENDDLPPEEWEPFCRGFARNLLDFTDGAIYCFMGSGQLPTLSRIFAEAGGHWSDYVVWDKGQFVLGRAPYQRSFEAAWFGWRKGAKPYWCGSRRESDVWRIERPIDSPLHPAMKPVPLLERAIKNSSRPGDIVLDLFLGSGSTVIACERTGRICHGLELDPHYASLSVVRWEAFTGRKAEKVD